MLFTYSIFGHGEPYLDPKSGDILEKFTVCTTNEYKDYKLIFENVNDENQEQHTIRWESVIRVEEHCISIIHSHEEPHQWLERFLVFLDAKTKSIDDGLRTLLEKSPAAKVEDIDVQKVLIRNLFEEGIMQVGDCSDQDTIGSKDNRELDGSILEIDEDGQLVSYETFGCVVWNQEEFLESGKLVPKIINVDAAAIFLHCRDPKSPSPYEGLDSRECFVALTSDTLIHEKFHLIWPAVKHKNGKFEEDTEAHKKIREETAAVLEGLAGDGTPPPIWDQLQIDPFEGYPKPIIYVREILKDRSVLP